jgi:glycolate oxidase iron-sulfur subunit
MKEYGRLLGTAEAVAFSSQVRDISELIDPSRLPELPAAERMPVIVQDPCHLRHVQGAHFAVRQMLIGVADLVELDDAGLCCGAGGAYSIDQPALANSIRERKVAAVERARDRSGAKTMASANPGCAFHLGAALESIEIKHPIEIVAEALR